MKDDRCENGSHYGCSCVDDKAEAYKAGWDKAFEVFQSILNGTMGMDVREGDRLTIAKIKRCLTNFNPQEKP